MKSLYTYLAVVAYTLIFSTPSIATETSQCLPNQKCDGVHEKKEHEDHGDVKSESGTHEHENAEAHGESEDHEEAERPSVGPGKAVEAANEDEGIKLSEKTIQFFKIRFARPTIQGLVITTLPTALVDTVNDTSIYRRRAGWIKEVKVSVTNRKLGQFRLIGKETLKSDDEIVVERAAIVKLAELESSGASGDGHGH